MVATRHLLCIGRYASSKQCIGKHYQALMYASKYMCSYVSYISYISFSTGLGYGMVIIDQVILGSRFFWKSSWENFVFQPSDGENGFNFNALSKGYDSSVVQYASSPGPALHYCQWCSNQTKLWDFNLFISGLQEANRESMSPHYQLELGGSPTVLRDTRLNAGPSSEHKRF